MDSNTPVHPYRRALRELNARPRARRLTPPLAVSIQAICCVLQLVANVCELLPLSLVVVVVQLVALRLSFTRGRVADRLWGLS